MQLTLKTKIFADGAEKAGMIELYNNPLISVFTTNPTLMRKAKIKDYKEFAQDILKFITDKPVSFEVFSDDFNEMENQATEIAKWGSNVIVKIPITNTKAESSVNLISKLSSKGIKINATAMMTVDQVISVLPALSEGPGGFVSVFAGCVVDAGVDPVPIMKEVLNLLQNYPNIELIWASPRELFSIVQANQIGCHIITVTNDILKKLPTIGKDLKEFSLDTVKMFFNDASAAGYTIKYSSEKVLL